MKEKSSYSERLRGQAQNLINAAGIQFRDFFIAEAQVVRRQVTYGTGRPETEEVVLFRAPKIQRIIRGVISSKKLRI